MLNVNSERIQSVFATSNICASLIFSTILIPTTVKPPHSVLSRNCKHTHCVQNWCYKNTTIKRRMLLLCCGQVHASRCTVSLRHEMSCQNITKVALRIALNSIWLKKKNYHLLPCCDSIVHKDVHLVEMMKTV